MDLEQPTNLLNDNLLWDVKKSDVPNQPSVLDNLLWKIEKDPSVISTSSSLSSLLSPVSSSNLTDDASEAIPKSLESFNGEDNENENNDDNYDNIISIKNLQTLDDSVPDEDGNQEPANCTFNAWVSWCLSPYLARY
jgi:hypothetical protein